MKGPPEPPQHPSLDATATALRAVFGKLRRKLSEQSSLEDISWSQLMVLGHLERQGPATASELALREGVRSQSMGASLASMEQAGLVSRYPDPQDRRKTLVALTEQGGTRVRAARAARQDWLIHAMQSRFSPAEQARLAKAIQLLGRLVDD